VHYAEHAGLAHNMPPHRLRHFLRRTRGQRIHGDPAPEQRHRDGVFAHLGAVPDLTRVDAYMRKRRSPNRPG